MAVTLGEMDFFLLILKCEFIMQIKFFSKVQPKSIVFFLKLCILSAPPCITQEYVNNVSKSPMYGCVAPFTSGANTINIELKESKPIIKGSL